MLSGALDALNYWIWSQNTVYSRSLFQCQIKRRTGQWGANTVCIICRSAQCDCQVWFMFLLVLHPWHHSQSHHSQFVCWFLQRATPSMRRVWNLFYKLKFKWVRERILEEKIWWHWSAGVGFMCHISPISGTKPSINLNVLLQNTELTQGKHISPPNYRVS